MKKKYFNILTVLVAALLLATFSACSKKSKYESFIDESEVYPVSSLTMDEEDAATLNELLPFNVYFANESNTKLRTEIRYLPASEVKKSINNLATLLVDELVKGPSAEDLLPVIPANATLVSTVKVEEKTAYVDFNEDFVVNHPGGKATEQMTLFSIVNTLTEINDIENVIFLVEGKTLPVYKEYFALDNPFPRSSSIIEKSSKAETVAYEEVIGDALFVETSE